MRSTTSAPSCARRPRACSCPAPPNCTSSGGRVPRLGATRYGLNLLPQHVMCDGAAVCTAWRHPTWSRTRKRGRNSLPSALPLTARSNRNRFAGWLCVCLLLLQVLAVRCHEPGIVSEAEAAASYAGAAFICGTPGSPVQPVDAPQKTPAKAPCACVFHTCGCCPAILTGTASLLPRVEPAAARTASYRGTSLVTNAILRNASVRGPPAFLA